MVAARTGGSLLQPRPQTGQARRSPRTSTVLPLLLLCTKARRQASQSEWAQDIIPFVRPQASEPVLAPPGAPPIVILPGFGNCSADYVTPFGNSDAGLVSTLARRGFRASVVQVERKDWVKVARAAFTVNFWRQRLTTDPGYDWYLRRVAAAVAAARKEHGCDQVILMGHSAGGWLGRAFLGDPRWAAELGAATAIPGTSGTSIFGAVSGTSRASVLGAVPGEAVVKAPHPAVCMLVTLGSPHLAPEAGATLSQFEIQGTSRDMTGGALIWLNEQYPGAAFSEKGVHYVCVGGRSVTGRRRQARDDPRTPSTYAHDAYMQVCGTGEGILGDAVVPTASAVLEGAHNIELDGVLHSMSRLGTFDEDSGAVWYGSEVVVDLWLHAVASKLATTAPTEGVVAAAS